MTAPYFPDVTGLFPGSVSRLPSALGRQPMTPDEIERERRRLGLPAVPWTEAGLTQAAEQQRQQRLAQAMEAANLGRVFRDVSAQRLPAVTIEARRPALPQLANVLARATRPELEGTVSTPTRPMERGSVGGVAAEVAAQPFTALMNVAGRIGEGAARTVGAESFARRIGEQRKRYQELGAPETGFGVATRVPLELAASAAPYLALGGGGAGVLRSAALTGVESKTEEGSTVQALADLTGSRRLKRLADSPLRTAADIALDVGFNVAPDVVMGALKGTRTAARQAEGVVQAAGKVAQQVGRNIAQAPAAAGRLGREVVQAARQEPIAALTAAATLGGEAIAPGLGTLAAAIPATTRRLGPQALPTLPQEVRSVGRFGFVRAPETYVLDEALEREHVNNVLRLTEPRLTGRGAKTTEVAGGTGLFGGEASPNALYRFDEAVDDNAIRQTAALRGLAYGQDQQLWYRRAAETDLPENKTASLIVTGPNDAPLSNEAIADIINRVRQPDVLGEYGGATRDGDHLMFLNLKRYTGLTDEEFNQKVTQALADVATRHDIQPLRSTYYAEHLDGTAAYLRTLGREPDALRAARDAIVDAAPEYRRYAERIGADVAEVDARIAERLDGLDRLLRQVEQPPPLGRTQGAIPLKEAAQTVYTRFPRILGTTPERVVPEMVSRLDTMVNDLVDQGVIPREMAQDWYRGATLDQRAIARLALPELREDPKYTLYTVVNSILSSGQEVPVETRQGLNVFNQYLQTGRFSILDPESVQYKQALTGGKKGLTGERGAGVLGERMAASPRTLNHEQALARLDAMVQALGEDGAVEALVSGVPIMAGRTVREERPALVYLFGPKIGQYAMDKLGIPGGGKSTIDLWMARLDYALRGDKRGAAGGKMQDAVSPEMRRRMQQVLAEFAARNNMPESSAQALAWYAIKNAFRNAGAKEKRLAYTTLGSGTTEALMSPAKDFSAPIAQGLMRGQSYAQAAEGWDDKTLREFARRTGRAGAIQPVTGAFAGKVFDIGGAAGEALKQIARQPAAAAGVGAVIGAAEAPEDRLGGAAVGALVGAGLAGASVGARQLLQARRALQAEGLPTALDKAYALAKGSIDFTGAAGRQIARRARLGVVGAFQKAVDSLGEIDRISARAEALGMAPESSAATGLNMALSSQTTAARALQEGMGREVGGIIDPETQEIVAPSLERVFQVLGGSPLKNEQGMTYAVALRRLGRYDRAAEAGDENPLRVYGGDAAMLEADRSIAAAFGQKPEFVEFANGLRQYTDGLSNYAVKTGLWTPEMAQAFRDSDALYVPFKRLLEAQTARPRGGMRGRPMPGQVTPGVQRFKGSDLMIGNPAEALAEYTVSLMRRADAYRVGTMLMDTVEALGEEGAGILTKIDATDPRAKAAAVANAEAAYRTMGLDEGEAEAMADVFARLSGQNEVIWRNTPTGKEYFLVNDPALLNALTTLNAQDGDAVRALVAVFGPMKRLATAFATGYAPAFWLGTNLPRDLQMGALQTAGIRPGDVAGGMVEAIKSIFGRSAEVEALSRVGAGQVSQFGGTVSPAAVARQVAPVTGVQQAAGTMERFLGAPLRGLERVGRASELPMRLAAARAVRRQAAEAGVSEAGQTALASRKFAQATVDFRRRSGYALDRVFEQTVPYYGAAKKGLGMFLQTAAKNPKRVGAAIGLVGLAVAMEDMLLGEGEQRAEALDRPAYERAKYLRLGDTKVALPQELAAFAAAYRVGLAQLKQDDPYVYEQFKQSLENLLPPIAGDIVRGKFVPFPVLGQLEEIAANRAAFSGRPIVPQGMERRLPAERRYETTAPTFDVLAAAARQVPGLEETSPLQAEYLVRGLTGRFTPAITAVTDIPAQAIAGRKARRPVPQPLSRQPLNPAAAFRVQPTRGTESERAFYDLRERYQQARGTVNNLMAQYERAQAANDTTMLRRLQERDAELQRDPAYQRARMDVMGTEAGTEQPSALTVDRELQAVLDAIQADMDKVNADFSSGRITATRARQLLDHYNKERTTQFRQAARLMREFVPGGRQ